MHILLIEPDTILSNIYTRSLMMEGHTVSQVVSAQSAVHMADERMPELVVIELQLPQHNGIEFLYEFRSYSEWLHIPAIIHSYVPPHEYNYAVTIWKELGVIDCLYKPTTSLNQLSIAISRAKPINVPVAIP
jgi:DNA-binding response OmpR family regulator